MYVKGDVKNLTFEDMKCCKEAYYFVKDGNLYKNRWSVLDGNTGFVEVVKGVIYINSEDERYIAKIKSMYANNGDTFRFVMGSAPTESHKLHGVLELIEFVIRCKEEYDKDEDQSKYIDREIQIKVSPYLKYEGEEFTICKIRKETFDTLRTLISKFTEVKIEVI